MPFAQSILEWCQSNKQGKRGTGSWAERVSSETIYYPTVSWREAPTSYGVGDLQDVDVQNVGQRLEAFKSWRIKEYSQCLCPGGSTWAVLFHLVSWRLAPQGVGQGDNTEDHLLPEVSSVCRPTRKILYLLLWVLLSPCVLKKQSYRLKTPILHIKLDIFSPNVNLYLIVSLSLTLWLWQNEVPSTKINLSSLCLRQI